MTRQNEPLVKICGIKSVEAAKEALDSGADMIGMIMVPNRSRTVNLETAKQISNLIHEYRRDLEQRQGNEVSEGEFSFQSCSERIRRETRCRPKVVGVFQNQPLSAILELQQQINLDVVQLHGSEPLEWCEEIPVPVIKRFTPGTETFSQCATPHLHSMCLLDGEIGGEGKLVDISSINEQANAGARFILAGGLTPDNVKQVLSNAEGVYGVDVSGGVETDGVKDLQKIRQFVTNAKQCRISY
jgi:phosphoribosylanthranilate isomerase